MGFPPPEPGLVLNYAYLWHDEHAKGLEEGRKDRPSVIVLCVMQAEDQSVVVTVLPITHAPPEDASSALAHMVSCRRDTSTNCVIHSWLSAQLENPGQHPDPDHRPQKQPTAVNGFAGLHFT